MRNIFVSSTFKDFQEERDTLRNVVLPRLNAIGSSFGEEYGFTDLRWGVNTLDMNEEESNREVLSVCFSEIDRCAPYMIVLLGERYGYTPDPSIAQQVLSKYDENVIASIALPEYAVSVTELEIRYRIAKANGDLENVWFYFRESEDECESNTEDAHIEDFQKMKELKEMILRIAPEKVRTYKKTADVQTWKTQFQDLVFQDISASIYAEREVIELAKTELNSKLGALYTDSTYTPYTHFLEYEKQTSLTEHYMEHFAGLHYVTAEKVIRKLPDLTQPLLIRGPVGCGKTVLVSFFANISEKQWGYQSCFASCMTSSHLSTAGGLIDYFKGFLNAWVNAPQLLFIVDGIDRLDAKDALYLLDWLNEICKTGRAKAIVSADNSFEAPLDTISFTLGSLGAEEVDAVTDSILKRYRKNITPEVKKVLMEKLDNPLGLEMALTELTLMSEMDYKKIYQLGDGISAIQEYQLQKVHTMPQDIEKMFLHLMETICELLSPRVWDVVYYMALSSKGLKGTTLIELLEKDGKTLTTLEISQIVNYLPGFFAYGADDYIDFMHACSRNALLKYMHENGCISTYAMTLADYCNALPEKDSLREELWSLLLLAEKPVLFFEQLAKTDADGRFMAAKHMIRWLLNFKTPREAGHLGVVLKGLDENNLICNMFELEPDDQFTFINKRISATLRAPSCDVSLLDEPLKKRVQLIIGAVKEIAAMPYEEHTIKSLLRFFGYELPIAYRFDKHEDRENSKRALSAIYVSLLEEQTLQQLIHEHGSLSRYYVDTCRNACEFLLSTGYFQDKTRALTLIEMLIPLIQNANQVDVFFALAQLKKIEGDIRLDILSPETSELSKLLYNESFGNMQRLLELSMAGHFEGQDLGLDDLTLVLFKGKAALAFAQLLWDAGGNENKSSASSIYEQIYNEISQKWNSTVQTETEKQHLNAEFASFLSDLHLAIAEDYRCRLMSNKLDALQWAEKGVVYAQTVVQLRGQTVTATERLYRAKMDYARIMYDVNYDRYAEINRSLHREINKWRMISGCRESMLLEADYYDMLMKYNGYDANSAEASIFAKEGHPYVARIDALRQLIEYADPSQDFLPFQ